MVAGGQTWNHQLFSVTSQNVDRHTVRHHQRRTTWQQGPSASATQNWTWSQRVWFWFHSWFHSTCANMKTSEPANRPGSIENTFTLFVWETWRNSAGETSGKTIKKETWAFLRRESHLNAAFQIHVLLYKTISKRNEKTISIKSGFKNWWHFYFKK